LSIFIFSGHHRDIIRTQANIEIAVRLRRYPIKPVIKKPAGPGKADIPPRAVPEKPVIDIHVHMGGTGDSGSGCRMSLKFKTTPSYALMSLTFGLSPLGVTDKGIRDAIIGAINDAKFVDYAVVVALDGVYRDGRYVESESHLVVPNDYVAAIARDNEKILFGASVHPYRKQAEMMREFQRAMDNGAVLFKWLPSAQQINPMDTRCDAFYKALSERGIPLLCHTGGELSVPTSRHETLAFNNPAKLVRALDAGVTVIAAHCATPYLGGILPADKDFFNSLMDMLKAADEKGWRLYADLSAMSTPTRVAYLRRVKRLIDGGRISPSRFLFGSDFPVPVFDISLMGSDLSLWSIMDFLRSVTVKNPIDKNYLSLKKFGLHDSIFTNAGAVLRM
jgi:predicted TIM-barrel fold metal-dependent hydrolase